MSYLVLARKYRPSGFGSVCGQEHVTRTLANAIKRDRVVHAYLFTGPRGVGKTSVARILSKALNCQQGLTPEPCLECPSCKEIAAGISLAVREIDGASHNSVDNVRELMDSFKSLPPPGYRYKVYIIDEVHMLSISAFNALLKSLEEPPPNTVFILATTESHKIPETVMSRCQRHDFRALPISVIESQLRTIVNSEKLEADPEAIRLIARLADGSMRDAQTLLDRVQSFCAGPLTAQETSVALGTVERRMLVALSSAILQRRVDEVLQRVADIFVTGTDPATVLREFVNHWRELFVAKLSGEEGLRGLGVNEDAMVELLRVVAGSAAIDMQDLWDVARDGCDRCLRSTHPRYGFESLAVRLATRKPIMEMAALIHGHSVTGASPSTPGGLGTPGRSAAEVHSSATSNSNTDHFTPANSQAGHVAVKRAVVEVVAPVSSLRADVPGGASPGTATSPVRPSDNATGLRWEDLLNFASTSGGRVLFENLKRIRAHRFEAGLLECFGPDLMVSMLTREKDKLDQLLADFMKHRGLEPVVWRVIMKKGAGAAEASSGTGAPKKNLETKDFQEHPAVQTLQKVFPGTKIEQVRLKAT